MEKSIEQLASLSKEEIIIYATETIHPFKCDWSGCEALLNCWTALKKHYKLHCKHIQSQLNNRRCGLRFCTLDKGRQLSLTNLIEHVNKAHLTRVRLPCPIKGCRNLELLDRIYHHVIENHDDSDVIISPRAFPSEPLDFPCPLPSLTNESLLKYTIFPLVKPSSRMKISKVTSWQAKPHHTSWSYFECHEQTEEKETKPHDLDFEPLQRPRTSSGLAVWPKFSICAVPTPAYRVQVSAPPAAVAKRLLLEPDRSLPPTYLYDTFHKYISEKKESDIAFSSK